MSESGPPPGWYQDPDKDHLERRWDGEAWTDERRPRAPQSDETPAPASPPEEKKEQEDDQPSGCAVLIGIALVIAALATVCTFIGGGDDRDGGGGSSGEQDRFAVQVVCEDFVTDRLKAPASAGFPINSDWTINRTGDTWTARSHVDAENSFGAQIRTNFTCEVRHVEGERWRLVNLDMEE